MNGAQNGQQGGGAGQHDLAVHGMHEKLGFLFHGKLEGPLDGDEQQDEIKRAKAGQPLVLLGRERGDMSFDRVEVLADAGCPPGFVLGLVSVGEGLERDLGIDDDGPVFRQVDERVRLIGGAVFTLEVHLHGEFPAAAQPRGLEQPGEHHLAPQSLQFALATQGLGQVGGLAAHLPVEFLEVVDFPEHGHPVPRLAVLDVLDPSLELGQLIVKGPEQGVQGGFVPPVEGRLPVVHDFPGQQPEILLDLPAGPVQQRFPFLHLLTHDIAGGLQGGVLDVDLPALPGQLVALLAQLLEFLAELTDCLFRLFEAQGEDQPVPLAAAEEDKQGQGERQHARSQADGQAEGVELVEKREKIAHAGRRRRVAGLSADPEEAAQFLEFFEKVERQGAARQVDAKIVLQPDRGLHPLDGHAGEVPFPRTEAFRGDDALLDHLMDDFRGNAAEPAQVGQGAAGVFIHDHALEIGGLFGHISAPFQHAG